MKKNMARYHRRHPYRESNAHCSREGAGDELSLIKLHQQRCLSHSAVTDQDRLQGNSQF